MKEIYLCSEYLKSHPLYRRFGCGLASLADRDYPGQGVFKECDIPAIDLDSYEKSLHCENDCTSDGVIGIGNNTPYGLTEQRLLLTELRIGYVNPRNLDFRNLRRKYVHSVEILREFDSDRRIDSGFALIFRKRYVPEAQNVLWRMSKEAAKKEAAEWRAYDPESFCNFINYGKPLPLLPTEETERMVREWCNKVDLTVSELELRYEALKDYWWRMKGRYRNVDLAYISEHMREYLSRIRFSQHEDIELCEYLVNEIKILISI
ncbi:MAG: hypothetical protein HDS22_06545 [Bacteroides sp.]|nr:hypothetical protein [Bacteroides sp.]